MKTRVDPRTCIVDFLAASTGPQTAEQIRAGIKSKAEIELLVVYLRVMVDDGQVSREALWPSTPTYRVAA